MGQRVSFPADVHIVVVGGGYAGNKLCLNLLDHNANFTLIDSRDSFHHNVASVRTIVVPGLADKTFIPYEATYGKHYRQGKVVKIDPNNKTLLLEGGEEVTFDILVLASGTTGPFPAKLGHMNKDEAVELYHKYADRVRSSTNIVIVGGGAVGVEITGEIATEFPDKGVTLIHGSSHLVGSNLSEGFQTKVRGTLHTLGVHVLLDQKVENMPSESENYPYEIRTTKDEHIMADLVIPCTGLVVNSDAYNNGLGKYVDERNALRVNRCFQVDEHEDIFAMGDCCASGDPWTAYLAEEHAKVVFTNISKKINGQPLASYRGNVAPMKLVLTIGRHHAHGELKGGWAIPDKLCRCIKPDLFIKRYWNSMRQIMPVSD